MGKLTIGHLPAVTVCDALAQVRDLLRDASGAIIRSLDSAHSEHDISHALSFHKVAHEVSLGNIFVRMVYLWNALDAEVFTGFDDVWIYRNKLPNISLGPVPSATSDGIVFSAGIPTGLAEAMEQTGCVLVVGDGCGLNYATFDDQIAGRLIQNHV